MNVYVFKDGAQHGPYTLEQLQQFIQQGAVSLQDQACYDGQNWVTIGQVPGIAQPAATPPQPAAQPQAQSASTPQATGQKKTIKAQTKPAAAATTQKTNAGGSRKWMIFGGIGALVVAIVTGLCIWIFSGDDDKQDSENPPAEAEGSAPGKTSAESQNQANEEAPATSPPPASKLSLIERSAADAGIVILVRINDLLEKGREDLAALLPPTLPPMADKAIRDPSSLGLDVSEPLQVHVVAYEDQDRPPTVSIAGKLSDREKFMNTVELLAGLDEPLQKEGYRLYETVGEKEGAGSLGIGADFFIFGGSEDTKKGDVDPSIERFVLARGEEGLLASDKSFAAFAKQTHDLSLWLGGDSIYQALDANIEDANFAMLAGGSGSFSLNFERGEMVAEMEFESPREDMVYGKGSFSDAILSYAPADAIFSLGFATQVSKFMQFFEKEILPEFGDTLNLDQAVEELGGMTIRDAVGAFTGEFLFSVTGIKMPDLEGEDEPFDDGPGANPFGDPEMEDEDFAFSGDGTEDEFAAEMNPAAMMMDFMPRPEFILAASIDTPKWQKLKTAPPLAMVMGLAMMQGYAVTEKNGFLLIASKEHTEATQTGSVRNPVSGAARKIFEGNDAMMLLNFVPILKMNLPIPPGGPMEALREISHLEMASNSGQTQGTGILRLVFADKDKNSLSSILELIKAVQTIVPEGLNDFDDLEEEEEGIQVFRMNGVLHVREIDQDGNQKLHKITDEEDKQGLSPEILEEIKSFEETMRKFPQ